MLSKESSTLLILILLALLRGGAANVGETCIIHLDCNLGYAGLGDQLEHYVHYQHVAKLLNASCVFPRDVFSLENKWAKETLKNQQHLGMEEYAAIANLLGLNTANNALVPDLRRRTLSYYEAVALHEQVLNGSVASPCGSMFEVSMYSCKDVRNTNCDARPNYNSLNDVIWDLRRNSAKNECQRLGLSVSQHAVHVVWHVRTGDICLHCDEAGYYRKIASKLIKLVPSRVHFIFEAQSDQIDFLRREDIFKLSLFYTNATLLATVCRFLTTQILITSGSSFPVFVAAFAPPWAPVIIEEERKEATWDGDRLFTKHFFKHDEAVLMQQGEFMIHDAALSNVFSRFPHSL